MVQELVPGTTTCFFTLSITVILYVNVGSNYAIVPKALHNYACRQNKSYYKGGIRSLALCNMPSMQIFSHHLFALILCSQRIFTLRPPMLQLPATPLLQPFKLLEFDNHFRQTCSQICCIILLMPVFRPRSKQMKSQPVNIFMPTRDNVLPQMMYTL